MTKVKVQVFAPVPGGGVLLPCSPPPASLWSVYGNRNGDEVWCEMAAKMKKIKLKKYPASSAQCKFQTSSLSDPLICQGPLITHTARCYNR